jgi:hypothetical protein
MTLQAWIFMLIVWAVIGGCTVYCFARLLTSQRRLNADELAEPGEAGQLFRPGQPSGVDERIQTRDERIQGLE